MPGLIPFLFDRYQEGQDQRAQEEQVRRLLEQQAAMADQLKASGTVPPTFGALLQSFQPPPPAPPPASGFLETLGQTFGDVVRGGRHRPPASLIQEESQQQTLNTVFRAAMEQQRETEREKLQTEREVASEKRVMTSQENLAARQRAGFAAAQQRAEQSQRAAEGRQAASLAAQESRQAASLASQEKLQTARETATATAAESKADRREVDRILAAAGPKMTKAQMNRVNRLIGTHPEWGYGQGFRWEEGEGVFGTGIWKGKGNVVPIEDMTAGPASTPPPGGAAPAKAAGTKVATDMTNEEIQEQFR